MASTIPTVAADDRRLRTVSVRGVSVCALEGSSMERYRIDTYEDKEPETLDWIDAHFCSASDVFFDVGANVGLFSLYAARRNPRGRICAFEPGAHNFAHLCANVRANDLDVSATLLINAALSDRTGFETLHLSALSYAASMHSLGDRRRPCDFGAAVTLSHGVIAVTLDDLVPTVLPHPTMLRACETTN